MSLYTSLTQVYLQIRVYLHYIILGHLSDLLSGFPADDRPPAHAPLSLFIPMASSDEEDGPAFMGGSLNFKGSKKKKKKSKKKEKKKKREREEQSLSSAAVIDLGSDEDLTEAEKRAKKFRREITDKKELEAIGGISHRERIENFNTKLGSMTEHNDIPRVSAAGNG